MADSRQKIIEQATREFSEYGYNGARMQRIADKASVNKAMIYYYFSSKDQLFETIIRETFSQIFATLGKILVPGQLDLEDMIRQMIYAHIDFLAANRDFPKILLREIHGKNPIPLKVVRELVNEFGRDNIMYFFRQVEQAKNEEKIRNVDAMQTLWSIIALNIFYFVTEPILSIFWQSSDAADVLENRKQAIIDLVLYGLLPRKDEE
ncbi:TetR family transcriptional regulator [candidate division KSB1 bacterium]|nr:TetR family transcriptional regulator [candidate division KSB1 bacterium]